jgi:hypothetical protein
MPSMPRPPRKANRRLKAARPTPAPAPPPPAAAEATWDAHAVELDDSPTHRSPKVKLGKTALTASIIIHSIFLVIAAIWVISRIPIERKDKLDFSSERPSASANKKAGEHDVKMQKKKSMGGAPPNAKRITSAIAKSINIPEIKDSSISDFQPNRMGGGMGSGFGGFGTGAGGPGGGMGTGGGGGRIKFFGFDADASSVILAIDVSGSMERNVGGPAGIAVLREEISKTINALSPGAIFNIICFSGQADACFQKSVRATEENKKAALRFMGGYYDGGAFGRTRTEYLVNMKQPTDVDTAIVEEVKFAPLTVNKVKGLEGTSGSSRMDLALVAAMERNPSTIFLLSDGQPTPIRDGKALDQGDIIKLVEEHFKKMYGSRPLVINTIYTNRDPSEEDFMKKISRGFNGKHKTVKLE